MKHSSFCTLFSIISFPFFFNYLNPFYIIIINLVKHFLDPHWSPFIIPSSVSFLLLHINKSLTKIAVKIERKRSWEILEEIRNLYKTIYHENSICQFLRHFPPTLRAPSHPFFLGHFSLARTVCLTRFPHCLWSSGQPRCHRPSLPWNWTRLELTFYPGLHATRSEYNVWLSPRVKSNYIFPRAVFPR